ncbi:MAG: FkbM family methyltransferase [Chthoniobacterales bacterium]
MKPTTILEVVRQVHNWPEVLSLKFGSRARRLSLLSTRDGVEVLLRRGCRDWDVFRELFLRNAYGRSLDYVASLPAESVVLDLGGNIGCFSLRAASLNPNIRLHSYEPGPPNLRIFRLNLLANPTLAARIDLHAEAVAGRATTTQWSFDEDNAGGSSLYGRPTGVTHPVTVRAFSEILTAIPSAIGLVKIDIEGAEYDVLRETPAEAWSRVAAFTIELHDDPTGAMTREQARNRFQELGYTVERDDEWTFFCRR